MKRWCVHHDAEIMQQVESRWVCWDYESRNLERCREVEALLIVKESDGSWPTADLEAALVEQGVLISEMYVIGFRHQDKMWRYVSDWRQVTEVVNNE